MKTKSARAAVLAISAALMAPAFVFAAENVVAEKQAMEPVSPPAITKKVSLSSYYDYGWVHQGSRRGKWGLAAESIYYKANDKLTPYFEFDAWDRFHEKDYIYNLGTYLKFEDLSMIRAEMGFGQDISYIYRSHFLLEYNHRLYKDLFWQLGGHYLNYAENDVYIAYPGLVYYFGDSYISGSYSISETESRGSAQWGTLKGNFAVNDKISIWAGSAIGERLYDIYLLPADKQYGYILFSGITYKINDYVDVKLGYSYSMEKPDFIKRSLEGGITCRF